MLHKNVGVGDNHPIFNWTPADDAALAALVVTSADVGKVAFKLDDKTFHILTDDSPVTWFELGTGGGGSSYTALVAETTITSAVQEYTFSGLDGDAVGSYIIEIIKDSAVGGYLSIYVNGDTTATNYYVQFLMSSSTSNTSGRSNSAEMMVHEAGVECVGHVKVSRSVAGRFVFMAESVSRFAATGTIQSHTYRGASKNAVANITSLTIKSASAAGLGVGTKLRLFKGLS